MTRRELMLSLGPASAWAGSDGVIRPEVTTFEKPGGWLVDHQSIDRIGLPAGSRLRPTNACNGKLWWLCREGSDATPSHSSSDLDTCSAVRKFAVPLLALLITYAISARLAMGLFGQWVPPTGSTAWIRISAARMASLAHGSTPSSQTNH